MARALSLGELVDIRRDLHRNPELSLHEQRTAGVVATWLQRAGFAVKTGVGGHGVVADLVGAHPGRRVIFRADIDALPIQEASEHGYASQNPGVMHACGHDVHTTVGIGLAHALAARRDELVGTIRFVFQPAEEAAPPPGQRIGAARMVEEGTLDGVDAAYALHVMPLLDVGTIGFTGGAVWAASDLFDIDVRGAMAHGAYPHEGRDPILAAAAIIQAIQQLPARVVDAREACVISVCRVTSGTAYNIIPDAARLQGLVRTLNADVRTLLLERLPQLAAHTATAYGCEASVTFAPGTALTANDPATERRAVDCVRALGDIHVAPFKPQLGAEDFSAFSTRVPGCYLFLGVRNEARGITHMIHTPRFDVDEQCIDVGVRAMSAVLLDAARG